MEKDEFTRILVEEGFTDERLREAIWAGRRRLPREALIGDLLRQSCRQTIERYGLETVQPGGTVWDGEGDDNGQE